MTPRHAMQVSDLRSMHKGIDHHAVDRASTATARSAGTSWICGLSNIASRRLSSVGAAAFRWST